MNRIFGSCEPGNWPRENEMEPQKKTTGPHEYARNAIDKHVFAKE